MRFHVSGGAHVPRMGIKVPAEKRLFGNMRLLCLGGLFLRGAVLTFRPDKVKKGELR